MGVNSKPGLTEVGKFNYLKAQVTGEAEHAITGFPITSGNYAKAIATLKERFGHPHKVANAHMTALLDLPHPTSHQPSLRSFYDTLETNIRALEASAKSQDTFTDLLVPVIWAKLPEETKCNLAWSQQGDYWTIQDLGEVLKELKVLEAGTTLLLEPTPTAPFFTRVGGSHPRGKGGTKSQSCPSWLSQMRHCEGLHKQECYYQDRAVLQLCHLPTAVLTAHPNSDAGTVVGNIIPPSPRKATSSKTFPHPHQQEIESPSPENTSESIHATFTPTQMG